MPLLSKNTIDDILEGIVIIAAIVIGVYMLWVFVLVPVGQMMAEAEAESYTQTVTVTLENGDTILYEDCNSPYFGRTISFRNGKTIKVPKNMMITIEE